MKEGFDDDKNKNFFTSGHNAQFHASFLLKQESLDAQATALTNSNKALSTLRKLDYAYVL